MSEASPPEHPLTSALGGVATALGLELTPRQCTALLRHIDLLKRWNSTYNLTAVREPKQMLTQHLADCLAVWPSLARHLGEGPRRLLDVGSGGGLPGLVFATLRESLQVTCVDTVGKKAAFVRQAALELGLRNLEAAHARVEQLVAPPFDVVACRAFASLPDFVTLTRRHLGPASVWLAMKGKRPDDEIAGLPADIEVFHVEPISVPGLAAERCVVWMRPRPPST